MMAQGMPQHRKTMGPGDGKYFSKTASQTHRKNVSPRPQRGGIRL